MKFRPPWTGVFPKQKARKIARQCGFKKSFPLNDKLNEVIWRYRRRKQSLPQPELVDAIMVGLWKSRNPKGYAARGDASRITAARRYFNNQPEPRGRPPDITNWSLCFTLGIIYKDGTGRNPNVTGRGRYRGLPYRFLVDVLSEIGIANPTNAMIWAFVGIKEPFKGAFKALKSPIKRRPPATPAIPSRHKRPTVPAEHLNLVKRWNSLVYKE